MNTPDKEAGLHDHPLEFGRNGSTDGTAAPFIDPAAEARVIRKLDLYISPLMTLVFLCAYLDRANIGNAASAGMTADLGMSSEDLGNAVTLFYVFYVSFEVPCSLVLKRFRPGVMIPALIFCWSVVLIGTAFMQDAAQMYASRLLLGLFESGMFPCLALYLSTFYNPHEQAMRICYLLVSAALSGAFGGLFAYALLKLDGKAGLAGWRWLFLVEGCASVLVSALVWALMPDSYHTARFLTDEDKAVMRQREELNARYHGAPEFSWGEVAAAFRDPKLYMSCSNQFWGDICSFGLSTFLPLIIKSFGFDTVTTQLLTIPVFAWGAVAYVAVSWMSDRWQRRCLFMFPAAVVTAVGYAINLGVPFTQRGALYFSLFLIAPGIYIILGLNAVWLLGCHSGYYKRATAIGFNQTVGNSAGFVVGQIFKTTVSGKYLLGLSFSLGSIVLAGVGHLVLYFFLRHQNTKRERMTAEEREQAIVSAKAGDFHPDYRYPL